MSGGLNNQREHASVVCRRSVKARFRRRGLCTAQRPIPHVLWPQLNVYSFLIFYSTIND